MFAQPVACPVLIGRALEVDALRRLIDGTRDHGHIVLIAGEAGVGKTRLVAEAKSHAVSRGFVLLQSSCFPQDRACPYGPLQDLLRLRFAGRSPARIAAEIGPLAHALYPLVPDLLPAESARPPEGLQQAILDPEQEQRRMFAALAFCLAAVEPQLLVVEDLHWSDEGTLDFLLYLLRRSAGQQLLLVGTYRSDEVSARLRHWLAQLDREHLSQELFVPPLTRAQVAEMLRTTFAQPRPVRAEFRDTIYSLSEGNPFYIEELLRSLIAAGDIYYARGGWERKPIQELRVPRSLHDAVQQRVALLSPRARDVLTLAAVIGRRFEFQLLQVLAQVDEEQLLRLIKELIAAQLVVEESTEQFAFRHALAREAIYHELLARERAALHHNIAETIERLYTEARELHMPVADLAYHFFEAGVWDRALAYAQRAGERAQMLYAPHAAIEQLTRALEAANQLRAPPAANLYLLRGHAYDTLFEFENARRDYEQALEVARAAGDGAAEWQALIKLGFLWSGNDYAQTGVYFRRALDLAQSLNDSRLLAESLNRQGNWQVNTGQIVEGVELHNQALALFQAQSDQQGIADTLDLLGLAYNLYGEMQLSVELYGQAIDRYRALGDSRGLASSLALRGTFGSAAWADVTLSTCWSYADCARDLSEALSLTQQIDWTAGQALVEILAGHTFGAFGNFGTALTHARQGLQIATAIDHRQWMCGASYVLGQLYLHLLAPDQALPYLETGLALAQALGSAVWSVNNRRAIAQACLLKHDLARAEAVLAAALPRASLWAEPMRNILDRRLTAAWAEVALAQNMPALALQIAEQLISSCAGAAQHQPIPFLLWIKGAALLALQRPAEAAQVLADAQRGAEQRDSRPLLWQILRRRGHAHQRLGQRSQAQRAFTAARELVDALAATVDEDQLREQFLEAALVFLPRPQPPTPRRAEAARYGGLTPREREVAVLIAQGKSNLEIADALVISKRTIETHVANLMAKLGVSSRAQIVAWAVEKGLLATHADSAEPEPNS